MNVGNRDLVSKNWRNKYCISMKTNNEIIEGDFYEFGVYSGMSMKLILNYFSDKINNSYGFDSFEGIPKEKKDKYSNKLWVKGYCDISKIINGNKNTIKINIFDYINNNNTYLIDGWYKYTLNKDNILKYNMKPASIIDIDCDIYTSSYKALDFIFSNNLVQEGTIILYDDWGGTEEYKGGESLAHQQIIDKYKVICEEIYGSKTQKIFKILSINYLE